MSDASDQLKRIGAAIGVDIEKAWRDAKANLARLDGCEGPHDFQPEPGAEAVPLKLTARQVCSRCGGHLEWSKALWYRRGLEDGRLIGIAEGGEGPVGERTPEG